jgi:hypothetical protein
MVRFLSAFSRKSDTLSAMRRIFASVLSSLILLPAAAPVSAASIPSVEVRIVARQEGSVPVGAQRVAMLRLEFRTSCIQGVTISNILLRHIGHGDPRDIERIYGYADGQRITRSVPFRRDGSVSLIFNSFDIPQCTSKTIDVVADFAADAQAAGEHAITLSQASDVVTTPPANVVLNSVAPVTLVRPTGRTVGTVDIQFLDLLTPPRFGGAQTVARFILKGGERDQEVSAITFTNDGSARDGDLENLRVTTTSGLLLSEQTAKMTGDTVRVEFSEPFFIGRNQSRMLQLRADVRTGRRRTIRFTVEEPSDVEAAPARYRGI